MIDYGALHSHPRYNPQSNYAQYAQSPHHNDGNQGGGGNYYRGGRGNQDNNNHGGNRGSWPGGWHGSRGWHNPHGYHGGGYYHGGWRTGPNTVVVWVNRWYPGWQVYRWRWDGYHNRWVVWIRHGSYYRTVYVGNNYGWHNYRGGYVW